MILCKCPKTWSFFPNVVRQKWYRNGILIVSGLLDLADPYEPEMLKYLRMNAWKDGVVEVLE